LVVPGTPRVALVDGVAAEAQRGDETSLRVLVRLEDLDVRDPWVGSV
jgi:hypothetical protein